MKDWMDGCLDKRDGMRKEESYQWVPRPFNEKPSEPALKLKTMDGMNHLCMVEMPPTPPRGW